MPWGSRRRWLRSIAGVVVVALLALTSTPVCGSLLDVDSVSCCEHHGCMAVGHDAASMAQGVGSHSVAMTAPLSCDSVRFDADRCCLEGQLTYPAAQVRASGLPDLTLLVALGFIGPTSQLPSQLERERPSTFFSKSPPTALYTLHATYRI